MEFPAFSFRQCLISSWAILRDHWLPIVSAAFVRELISLLAACLAFALLIEWRGWNLLIAVGVRIISWSVLQAGYVRFCLKITETNEVHWAELIAGLRFGLQMFIANIFVAVAVAGGLILLVAPGLFLATRLCLYGQAVVEQQLGAAKSLMTSHNMLKGYGKYTAGILVLYCIGMVWTGFTCAFDSLLIIFLCRLYIHLRGQEART